MPRTAKPDKARIAPTGRHISVATIAAITVTWEIERANIRAHPRVSPVRGLIDYSRGSIRILDDAGLEAASCSCYELVSDRAPTSA
jgi:hypothetical protein